MSVSVTQGISAPTTLRWVLYGIEILGSGGVAPTRVALAQPATDWTITATTAVTSTSLTLSVGDQIVILEAGESDLNWTSSPTAPTLSAGAATWTMQLNYHPGGTSGNQAAGIVWTGVVTTGGTATVTVTRPYTAGTLTWGFTATQWSGSSGIGVTFSGNNGTSTGAASAAATCSDHSAVQCQINDWNAGATTGVTWLTINGAPETQQVAQQSSAFTIYGGYRTDVGGATVTTIDGSPTVCRPGFMAGAAFPAFMDGPSTGGWLPVAIPYDLGAPTAVNVNGDATVPLTYATAGDGLVGALAGAALALTFGVTAAGVVGTSTGSSVPATYATTSAGQVGTSTGSSVPLTFGVTAAGSAGAAGVSSGATVPLTYATTAAGTVGAVTGATVPLTFAVTSSGIVGTSAGASVPLTFGSSSAGIVGTSAGASVPLTFGVTSAGTAATGPQSGASVPLTYSTTGAGMVGRSSGSTVPLTFSVTSAGSVFIQPSAGAAVAPAFAVTAAGFVDRHTGATLSYTLAVTSAGTVGGALTVAGPENTVRAQVIPRTVEAESVGRTVGALETPHRGAAAVTSRTIPAAVISRTEEV